MATCNRLQITVIKNKMTKGEEFVNADLVILVTDNSALPRDCMVWFKLDNLIGYRILLSKCTHFNLTIEIIRQTHLCIRHTLTWTFCIRTCKMIRSC